MIDASQRPLIAVRYSPMKCISVVSRHRLRLNQQLYFAKMPICAHAIIARDMKSCIIISSDCLAAAQYLFRIIGPKFDKLQATVYKGLFSEMVA